MFKVHENCNSISKFKKTLKDKNYRDFIWFYVNNKNKIIYPLSFFNMFRFYKIEKRRTFDNEEIGEYVLRLMNKLKYKEFHGNSPKVKQTISQFLSLWKKLEINLSYSKRCMLLKEFLLMSNDINIKWIARFLCKKVKISKRWINILKEEMKNETIQNSL